MEGEKISASPKEEKILCAAILFEDGQYHSGQPKGILDGVVVCGRRHHIA